MIFINPRTDFAFKKIFGSEQSRDILISFLNGILYEGKSIVQTLTILQAYEIQRIRGFRSPYLYVRAKLNNGDTVIIQIQVLNFENFESRILRNAVQASFIKFNTTQHYEDAESVIALTITTFDLFYESENTTSRYLLDDNTYLMDYSMCNLELVFVELPKFNRSLSELTNLTDYWMYFLQNSAKLKTIPEELSVIPEISRAFTIASKENFTTEELEEERHELFYIYDYYGAIAKAKE